MQSNFEHCAALVREHERDRYLATLFAPAEKRDALFPLYAFHVEIGRVRALSREPIAGEIRLQWWREVLCGERDGEARAHPVAAALREALRRHGIGGQRLLGLIDAHGFDLYDEPMANLAALQDYAVATDSTVMTVAGEILSADAPETVMRDAGVAQTFTSVLQSFALHAARRQLYVPLDVSSRHGVDLERIFAGQADDALRAALGDMRAKARAHLAAAGAHIGAMPDAILPVLLPLALIGPELRAMDRRDYDPFRPKPLPPWRRQWLLWRAARNPRRIFE
jgi:15-cis-phytoene synthase